MTLINQRNEQPTQVQLQRLVKWITYNDTTVPMGTLRAPYYIHSAHIHVTEAFDDSGTDNIRIGFSADSDAFVTDTDVSTTGVKSITLGANNGYNGTSYAIEAEYDGQNSDATTGKAILVLEFWRVPPSP